MSADQELFDDAFDVDVDDEAEAELDDVMDDDESRDADDAVPVLRRRRSTEDDEEDDEEEEFERDDAVGEPDEEALVVEDDDEDDYSVEEATVDAANQRSDMCGLNYVSRYERANLLLCRARQLEEGAMPMIDVPRGTSPYDCARMEYEQRMMPLMLKRTDPYTQKVYTIPLSQLYI
jgi:DNA-directed RNA polymerase subunit K/omega